MMYDLPITNIEVFTIEEAAKKLKVGRSTAYRLVKEGKLRTAKIGRGLRIPHDCIIAYLNSSCYSEGNDAMALDTKEVLN